MAWTVIGSGGTAANTANNQASIALTVATNAINVGDVAILAISQDNATTADSFTTGGGSNTVVSTVADSAGNTWTCAGEFVNGQGTAQTGVICSVWYTRAATSVAAGGTVTATFVAGSSASFDESAASLHIFNAENGVSVLAATGLAADGTTAHGLIDQTVSTGPNLRFRAIATESSNTTALTTSSGWSPITFSRSGNVAGATAIRGEYLITASSTAASAPSFNAALDHASVYFVLQEDAASFGDGAGDAVIEILSTAGGASIADSSGSANVDFAASGQADAAVPYRLGGIGQGIGFAGIGGTLEPIDDAAEVFGDGAGSAVIDFSAAGVGASVDAQAGAAVVDIAVAGVGASIDAQAGAANVDFAAAAVGDGQTSLVGAANVDFASAGVGVSFDSQAGSANVDFSAAGAGASQADSAGAAVVDFALAGVGASFDDQAGDANIDFVAAAAGDGQTSLVGDANVDFSATAGGASQADAAGAANIDFNADGAGQAIATAGAGEANVDFSATAAGESFADAVGAAVVDFASAGAGASQADSAGDANVDFAVSGVITGLADIVGSAEIDFSAEAGGGTFNDGVGSAEFDFSCLGVSAFSRRPIKVIIAQPKAKRGATGIDHRTAALVASAKRGKTVNDGKTSITRPRRPRSTTEIG